MTANLWEKFSKGSSFISGNEKRQLVADKTPITVTRIDVADGEYGAEYHYHVVVNGEERILALAITEVRRRWNEVFEEHLPVDVILAEAETRNGRRTYTFAPPESPKLPL